VSRNVILSAVSTLILLVVMEAALRVSGAVPAQTLRYVTPDMWSTLPGPLLPGQSFTDRMKRRLPYHVTVNELGFRGVGAARLEPASGSFRILCLGDSFTFGAYVDDAETWPVRLEAILAERRPRPGIDVVNAGINGFTIVDELEFMQEHGLTLKPDLVVLGFVLNDLADMTRRVPMRRMMLQTSREHASLPLGPLKAALHQTAIYNAMLLVKTRWLKISGDDPTLQAMDVRHLLAPQFDSATLELFAEYRRQLEQLKRLLDERRVPLVVVIFPYWEQLAEGAPDLAQSRLEAMMRELGIPALDLLPSFRAHDPDGSRFFLMPRDHHASPEGYRQAAIDIAAAIEPLLGK